MSVRIKSDTLQALQDWKSGKPVKSLELGHVHRMKEVPGFSPTIDASVHLHRDQERAHAYLFHIIDWFTQEGTPLPVEHDAFLADCDVLEQRFREENAGLTAEELDAAEGLAWKALRFGWAHAIHGHAEHLYTTVTNPAVTQEQAT
jgi:hypothetical protein